MKYIKEYIFLTLIILILLVINLIFVSASNNFIVTYKNGTEIKSSSLITINETRVIIKATNNHLLGFIIYGLNKITIPTFFNKLCSNCQPNVTYSRILSLSEGRNNILVKDSDNQDLSINITVDTKKPIITSITGINNNGYSKGLINITFIEINPKIITLNYRESSSPNYILIPIQNLSGKCTNKTIDQYNCQFDISDQNGKTLNLFFNVSDKFYTIDSRTFVTIIDSTKPTIQVFSPANSSQFLFSKPILLSVGVNEFSRISYDVDFDNPKRRLCGDKCTYVQGNLRLSRGTHIIRFFAEDIAGNKDESSQITIKVI